MYFWTKQFALDLPENMAGNPNLAENVVETARQLDAAILILG